MSQAWDSPAGTPATDDQQWPQTPGELDYQLDLVLRLFDRLQNGERVDLLEELLGTVNWREMFGSAGSGLLKPEEIEQLKTYYRAKFAGIERYYLAEQLSTQLMSALLASGDIVFSDDLNRLGRENPELWKEIRTFFSRKELATATALVADQPRPES
jgi:hypothetical protein